MAGEPLSTFFTAAAARGGREERRCTQRVLHAGGERSVTRGGEATEERSDAARGGREERHARGGWGEERRKTGERKGREKGGHVSAGLIGDVRVRARVSSEVRTDLRGLKRASREPSRDRGRVRANLVLSAPAPTSGN